MKKKSFCRIMSVFLLCALIFNLSGCITVGATDLMRGIEPDAVDESDLDELNAEVTDFAVRLFKAAQSGKNTFISPVSVLFALAMTSNGADGETLSQMEQTLGVDSDSLNSYLHTYMSTLTENDKTKLAVANSIWFKDDDSFNVNSDFLQINGNYYGAEIYKAPFDMTTLFDINNWVRRETRDMIPSVIDRIPDDSIMYLINTLAFESEWASTYKSSQVRKGSFTKEDGNKVNVDLMYSTERKYIEDENATGFIKYYKGKYAFVALLPNEGVSLSDYISSLSGDRLSEMLSSPLNCTVKTSMPKFKTEYCTDLSDILYGMGMTDAFDVFNADFSRLGSYEGQNIYIGSVIHKTYIEIAERGTKAGAVTVVGIKDGSAVPPEEYKEVYLDRPFVYMIIDTDNNIPLFIGSMTDVKN